ncbi:MAG: ferritin family protein [Desulfuromonadaceae bacterium]|nr:ferritin family protein [Desulfuromonadaceae bacterium]
MNILESTIEMKKETQAHYERLADTVANKELKHLFSLFAAAEGEYVEKLMVLENDVKINDTQRLNELDDTVCLYSPHVDLVTLAETMKDDPDACRLAEQEENEMIEFFDFLSNQTGSESLKKTCQMLAGREKDHLKMLEEIYFFVEQPKSYLEWGEFSNLKSL